MVSVIVPVFNCAATIERTIASVLDQSETDFELILVDDGSTDSSLARLREAADADARVRILSGPNAGVSAARNRGAAASRGRFLAFLDGDDLWAPGKLASHLAAHLADPDLDLSYAGVEFMTADADAMRHANASLKLSPQALTLSLLVAENPLVTASNLVVTRAGFDRLGGFTRGLRYAEDQELLIRAYECGRRIRALDKVLVGYRDSPGGLSSQLEAMLQSWRGFSRRFAGRVDLRRAEALYCRNLARRALRGRQPKTAALRYAARGLRLSASAFLENPRRGGLTLAGALLNPVLPADVRASLFS